MPTKQKLDNSDLQSLEMDIVSIRHKGGVQAYLSSESGKRFNDILIAKLERLLAELKGDNQ